MVNVNNYDTVSNEYGAHSIGLSFDFDEPISP